MNAGVPGLLTGGDGAKPGTVKDAAICPAREEDWADWLGVVNAKTSAPARRVGRAGLVLTPGFEHRRNFIERASAMRQSPSVSPTAPRLRRASPSTWGVRSCWSMLSGAALHQRLPSR